MERERRKKDKMRHRRHEGMGGEEERWGWGKVDGQERG